MEVVGTTVGVVSLIPQLLGLVQRVSTAISDFEDAPKTLATVSGDLNSLKLALELINDKPVLQTNGVKIALAGLIKVAEEAERQVNHIIERTPGRTPASRVGHALIKGPKEQGKLAEQVDKLMSSKMTLCLHIQVAVVGLCEATPQGSPIWVPAINSIVMNEVNQEVEKKLGKGLRIADIVKGKVPDENGLLYLTEEDYRRVVSLQQDGQLPTTNIRRNTASNLAMQVNESVDDELINQARDYNLNVEYNLADHRSTQINTRIKTDTFNSLLRHQMEIARNMPGHGLYWNEPVPPMPLSARGGRGARGARGGRASRGGRRPPPDELTRDMPNKQINIPTMSNSLNNQRQNELNMAHRTPDTASFKQQCCISELARHLASEARSLTVNEATQTRVLEVLPDLLRDFALKVGYGASNKMHTEAMSFVHESRHEITAAFVDIGFSREDVIKEDPITLGDFRKTRVHDWVKGQDMTGSNYPDPGASHNVFKSSKKVEESDGEGIHESWLQEFRESILRTPSFRWLLARLQNELRLFPTKPYVRETIGKQIISALLSFGTIGKEISSPNHNVTFELEWDIFEFFKTQGYSRAPHEVFEQIITLTGSSLDAQAAPCAAYLSQNWPLTTEDMVALLQGVLKEQRSDPPSRELSDGTMVQIRVRNSTVLVEARGVAVTIMEIGEQLAWLGAALRTSPVLSGLVYCTPTIISILPNTSTSSWPELRPYPINITCKIGFTMEKIPATPTANGQCWQAIFKNPVIVRGYPITQRTEWNTGLEIPLSMMSRLARALEIQQFKDKVCIKGFSTMLVPIRRYGDLLCWHLLYKKDGSRISYLDNDLDQEKDIVRLDLLEHGRHVLGWCSKAKLFIGCSVEHSWLPKPEADGALTGRRVRCGKAVPGAAAVLVGARESSPLLSDGYVDRLLFLKRHFVLLWDKRDRRGWLVSGIIALLLALRVFLNGPYKSAIRFRSEDFEMSDKTLTPMSAFDTLNNDHNQNLLLYSGTSLKSKIENLGGLLEILIDHQIDVTERCDIKLSTKPRGDLEGWEFEDVAGVDQEYLHPHVAKIMPHGKGWVDFTRAIQAVTLFGCGFGDIIRPDVKTCSRWTTLPTGRYYIAVCVSDLEKVFKEHGLPPDGHIRLSDDLIWHTPAKSEFCQCPPCSGQDRCEPVQTVFPLALSRSLSPRRNNLPEEGALIFGHNSRFPWVWDNFGNPQKGHLGEPVSNSPKDSGIGSPLTSSESEGKASSSSKRATRFRNLPSAFPENPLAPPMSEPARRTYPSKFYRVGILCALSKELVAVRALFDEIHDDPEDVLGDRYVFGKMGQHMVVATCLSKYGTTEAASAAGGMKYYFNLKFCLLVGIGGGVPSHDNDIRLGDVVVGKEIVQYDLGYRTGGSFSRKDQPLRPPPDFLLDAISNKLEADPNPPNDQLRRHLEIFSDSEHLQSYCSPGKDQDVPFQLCSECRSSEESCPEKSQHKPLHRDPRPTDEPMVHYGKIASGNQVIKDAEFRDEQARSLKVICFEMEAAGVVNLLPCLVIRGICDYCDAHKNDIWQGYASATAAAYAKLLLTITRSDTYDNLC